MATYNICCKGDPSFFLTVRDGLVVFTPANKNDENQHWFKYMSTGSSSFAVVHKVTGRAIKFPTNGGPSNVELTPYNSSNKNDPYILWNENDFKDEKDGYKTITSPKGGSHPYWCTSGTAVNDGARVYMYPIWKDGVLNLWKMIPLFSLPNNEEPKDVQIVTPTLPPTAALVRIHSKLKSRSLFLSIKDHKVVLATSNPSDEYQQWYVYMTNDGSSSFAVVNKATKQAIKQPLASQQLGLDPYSSTEDVSLLWAEYDTEDKDGYICIKMATNNQVWDVENNIAEDGNPICCWVSNKNDNQLWMMTPCAQLPPIAPLVRLYCKAGPNFSLSMGDDGKVVLASQHPYDKLQQWYKVDASNHINEDNGYACYVYVNRRTGNAIKMKMSSDSSLSYTPFHNTKDKTIAWIEKRLDDGYKIIKSASKSKWFFDTNTGEAKNGVIVQNHNHWNEGKGQQWKSAPCAPLPFNRLLVRVFCKDQPDFCITVTNGKVVVGPADFKDKFQLWNKVDASEQVNDEDGNFQWPCFALVNNATGMAIQHLMSSGKAAVKVTLTRYISKTDTSILWFEYSLMDGSKAIRPVTKSLLALESLSDPANYDVVTIGCFSCSAKSNQQWFISPIIETTKTLQFSGSSSKSRIFTKNGFDNVITIRYDKVVLAPFNLDDNSQAWHKEIASKDENGSPSFILINRSTGLVIKYPKGVGQPLELVPYDADVFDKSILWSEWSLSDGYVAIGLMNDYSGMTWDAKGSASDGVVVGCNYYFDGNNDQRWRIGLY